MVSSLYRRTKARYFLAGIFILMSHVYLPTPPPLLVAGSKRSRLFNLMLPLALVATTTISVAWISLKPQALPFNRAFATGMPSNVFHFSRAASNHLLPTVDLRAGRVVGVT